MKKYKMLVMSVKILSIVAAIVSVCTAAGIAIGIFAYGPEIYMLLLILGTLFCWFAYFVMKRRKDKWEK